MNVSIVFVRVFFTLLSMLFVTIYSVNAFPFPMGLVGGLIVGLLFGLFLVLLDVLFRRFNLRSFNVALIGLFFGYLMGQALVLISDAILKLIYSTTYHTQLVEIIEIGLFLFGIYLGLVLTLRASDELYVSLPFVKFSTIKEKKKDLIIDPSALADSRILDLALSGLIDFHLIVPRFVIRALYAQAETKNEMEKSKAKRSLDTLKRLEEHPELGIRYNDTDFPEVQDVGQKLTRLSRLIDANIITADISSVQSTADGVRIINIHTLSSALKPLTETGEWIRVKIQRQGKEPNQGVGYLEDGTMVVVNDGAQYIGQTIDVNVISVKHTSSGRMIFCNASGSENTEEES